MEKKQNTQLDEWYRPQFHRTCEGVELPSSGNGLKLVFHENVVSKGAITFQFVLEVRHYLMDR